MQIIQIIIQIFVYWHNTVSTPGNQKGTFSFTLNKVKEALNMRRGKGRVQTQEIWIPDGS